MNAKTLGLAGALALLTATAGYAQPPSAPPSARAQYDGQRTRPDPAQMAERRAQHLRDTLQLRPDKDAALRAYIEASRPNVHRGERGDRGERGERGEARAMTTPERLDRMRARMAEHQAAFERRAEATKRFYAQLSPSQQKAFDASGWQGGRHGRGGRDGHRGGRG
jgi:Spy/CpxP family protein refolding chaperone